MSTHNICFRGEIRKILFGYPLLSVAMIRGKMFFAWYFILFVKKKVFLIDNILSGTICLFCFSALLIVFKYLLYNNLRSKMGLTYAVSIVN